MLFILVLFEVLCKCYFSFCMITFLHIFIRFLRKMQTQTYHPRLLLCKCTVLNKYIKHKFFLCLPTYLEFASCYVNTMRSLLLVHAECTGRSEVKNQDIGMRPNIMQRFLLFLCHFLHTNFFRKFFVTGQPLAYIIIICLHIPQKRENRQQIFDLNFIIIPTC